MGGAGRKGIGSPYAVRDYLDLDPEFGSLDEMRNLIRAAHAIGLRVLLDMVPNHTSRDHAWVQEKPRFYVKGEDGEPVFDADWSDTAKLDYAQPEVRGAMIEACDFWLSLLGEVEEDHCVQGVDGFRFDMAHHVNELGFWNEALADLRGRHPGRQLLFLAECYGRENNIDLFNRGFDAAYDDDLFTICRYMYALDESGQTCILLSPEATTDQAFSTLYIAYLDRGLAGAVETALLAYEDRDSDEHSGPYLARYTDNHDEGRGVFRFGDGAVLAMQQLIFLAGRSIPLLLAGQEFGAVNRPSIHQRLGTTDKGYRRREADGVVEQPGIEFEGNLFARDPLRRRGWYAFYEDLIGLRLQNPELTRGDFRLIECGERCPQNQRTVIGFERKFGDQILRCAVNMGPEPRILAHRPVFRHTPIFGVLKEGTLAPFTSIVVRST
jgi:glycosidase